MRKNYSSRRMIVDPTYKPLTRATTEEKLEAVLKGGNFSTTLGKLEAMQIPAVATAVEFISSTISCLPVKLYSKEGGVIQEVTDDYRLRLLNGDTGDLLDAAQCKKAMIADALLDGAGYAFLPRKGNKIKGVYYVDDSFVTVVNNTDHIFKDVKIRIDGKEYREFEVFRITRGSKDGVKGVGIIEQVPLLLATMFNALKYENASISSGTKRGFLKAQHKLDRQSMEELKLAWKRLYSTDANSSQDVMILNQGLTFEPANSTATENQLNESKKVNSEQIYNMFGLTNNLFGTTTVNAEVYINAIKTGILPLVKAIDIAINKFFLLEKEKETLFFKLDTSDLLKASIEERFRSYDIAIKAGFMQLDEVRNIENMSPLGFDYIKLGLGDVLYNPKTKEIYVTNTNTSFDLDDIKKSSGKEGTDNATDNPQ